MITTYNGSHVRVAKLWGRAAEHPCITCGQPAAQWSYDGTDPSELTDPKTGWLYSIWPEFYAPRCTSCHRRLDFDRRAARQCHPRVIPCQP